MEHASFGSGPSKSGRIVARKASTASKTSPDPVVPAQPNMLTQSVRYWPIIHIFYKNRIACILNIHQSTVQGVLREDLSLRNIDFKWISYLLDDGQELERIQFLMNSIGKV
jgi:hypothetical protein